MMLKVGKYTGTVYNQGEKIEECCFNISDKNELTEEMLGKQKNDCIMYALMCNFSSPCMPCRNMK